MVYAEFGGQTECIMGNWKIENCRTLKEKIVNTIFFVIATLGAAVALSFTA